MSIERPRNGRKKEAKEPTVDQGAMERLRNMPGRNAILLALIATGQLSLYVPRRIEAATGEVVTEQTPTPLMNAGEAREALSQADPESVVVDVEERGGEERLVITLPGEEGVQVEADAALFTEVVIPGSTNIYVSHANMEWAGRGYEKEPELKEGEDMALEQQIQIQVARVIQDLEQLGLQPKDVIEKATIATKGYASPEGTTSGNKVASDGRAQAAFEAAKRALELQGIQPEKISGTAQGMGAEGSLDEFVQALETSGTVFTSTTAEGKTQEALAILKKIHNGADTDPSHLQAKANSIDAHRRADVAIQLDHVQVILRFPPNMEKEAQTFAVLAKEYATAQTGDGNNFKPPIIVTPPPVDPPPPPPDGYGKLQRIALYADQKGKSGYAPVHQVALGVSSSKGAAIGRGHSRQGFKRSQQKHHTGKR